MKTCPKCHTERLENEFRVLKQTSKSGKRWYRNYCWPCEKIRLRTVNKKIFERNKVWLEGYKKAHPCAICGEAEPICLDFHHIKPKPKRINKVGYWVGRSSDKTRKEGLKNTLLVCSNCHRKIHLVLKLTFKAAGISGKGAFY